jgi:acetyl-CoA carboxylase biotin carboxylase subunit
MFRKVLVANRGEIAVRIVRALRELGIPSVAIYSDADRTARHVRMADEAAYLGPAPSAESYLNIERILAAARAHGADAVHPGYGFLSENADFAEACEQSGLTFIGPPASAIRRMGSKLEARGLARAAGVPVVPGTEEPCRTVEEARRAAARLGCPVLLKADAGGGGKGMRFVERESELEAALRDAASEAERAFGNPAIYVEKVLDRPRHIEIQVLGDRHGNFVHLGERECSLQRRHQKVVEECPSPLVTLRPELRQLLGEAALRIARAAGYRNAGTVEFLVDSECNFYFLEMNTRLQVEHPVTELVTGLDLVHWQIRVAAGEPLAFRQQDIQWRGAALECRIYAEDPENHFFPCPGLITGLTEPSGPGVRLDSGIEPGWQVPVEYDPLLAKLVVWAETRPEAIARMRRALGEYWIGGIKTNLPLFRQILDDEAFGQGRLHTLFLQEFLSRRTAAVEPACAELEAAVALAAAACARSQTPARRSEAPASLWRLAGRERMLR